MRFKIFFEENELRNYDPEGKSIIVGAVIQIIMIGLAIAAKEYFNLGMWSMSVIIAVVVILFGIIIFPNIMYQFPE